jgi:hypothetical protein
MSGSQTPFARRSLGVLPRIARDRRRHRRLAVTLLGRCLRVANKQAYPYRLMHARAGALISHVGGDVGERVVAYFDNLGGSEGPVTRGFDAGCTCKLKATPHTREKLAAELAWLESRAMTNEAERRQVGVDPGNSMSQLPLADGVVPACQVLDVAIFGASIKTPAQPEFGPEVMPGKLRARHLPAGAGLWPALYRANEPGGAAALFRVRG